jgi:hypothetical protein
MTLIKLMTKNWMIALCGTMLLSSCEGDTTGQGALHGAAFGAAGGAVLGGLLGNNFRGAAIGSLAGAGLGALTGAAIADSRRHEYDRNTPPGGYPVGSYTQYRGFVRSPYYPNHLIDVRGIPSGALVMDPSVDRPFIRP